MNINIICIGKIKEKYIKDGISEYSKRLSKYCKLNIIELPDEKVPDNPSLKEIEIIKNIESNKILNILKPNTYKIALDLSGKQLTSEELASTIKNININGKNDITFIIGGSHGHSETLLNKVNMKLSFSKLTFPHQLFRLILIEQIYRTFKINNNESYHK